MFSVSGFRFGLRAGLAPALVLGLSAGTAFAFDPNAGVSKESGPWDLFKFGFSAYKKGDKDDAVEAYRYAAEKGHPGARWKLARMYAEGDGVKEDDYTAFQIFEEIVREGAEPGSRNQTFVADALTALAGYVRRGIPGSPVEPDPARSRILYFEAASAFGVPEAQYQLARMIMEGEGGRADPQEAKKWLNLARKKGHAPATAVLGNILFQEGHTVRGLALLTVALKRANDIDAPWIRTMQEQAFSLTGEDERRSAVALAQGMMTEETAGR